MHKMKITPPTESKLSKTIAKIAQDETIEKSGFLDSRNDKTIYYKTKSFRLRQSDFANLASVVKEINKLDGRKNYSDSEVIRGLVNYSSDNISTIVKRLISYVKNSS